MAHSGDDGDGGTHDHDVSTYDREFCHVAAEIATGMLAVVTSEVPPLALGIAATGPFLEHQACDDAHVGRAPTYWEGKIGYDSSTQSPPTFGVGHHDEDKPFIDDHNNPSDSVSHSESHGFDWQAGNEHSGAGFDWQAGNDHSGADFNWQTGNDHSSIASSTPQTDSSSPSAADHNS